MLAVDENDELFSALADKKLGYGEAQNFAEMILENLRTAGVQQAHKEDRIEFTSLTPWPGHYVCAEGRYVEGGGETGATRRAGSSSALSSAPSRAPTWSPPRARPPTPASTC